MKELYEKYGALEIPLGNHQKHSRGNVILPISGAPDVLAAVHCLEQEDGSYRAFAGESYICLVRFGKNGVEIETVNAYGSSSNPNSKHFTTQMELYTSKKLKKMSLDKEYVLSHADTIYTPLVMVE